MGGRDHLYTDTNTFSFMDLEELEKGELTTALKNAIKFCLGHVSSCLICAGRGFICEVCQVNKKFKIQFNFIQKFYWYLQNKILVQCTADLRLLLKKIYILFLL